MSHDIEREEIGGVILRVVYDETGDIDSPIDSHDKGVRFMEWSRHGVNDSWNEARRDMTPAEAIEWAKESRFIAYPVFKYEHGGVAYSLGAFSCPWDSGQCGFLFLSRKEWKRKSKKSDSYAKGVIESYSAWCNGQVFGFIVEDEESGEEIDSCWGFIGESDYCLEQGRDSAKYHAAEIAKREAEEEAEEREAEAEAFEAACYAGRPDLAPQWEAAA
jgi:hypothetical protein